MTDLSSLVNGEQHGLNILLLGPTHHETTTEAHHSLLTPEDPTLARMLFVTYRKSPDAVISEWRSQSDEGTKQIGIISMGERMRGSQTQFQQSPKLNRSVWVDAVQSPGDLTGLGIRFNRFLDRFEQDVGRLVVCFDSLTALLQYVDEKTAYRFLQMATGKFQAADAVTHFHLDPDAHTTQTVAKFKTLFDSVVKVSDGKITIQKG